MKTILSLLLISIAFNSQFAFAKKLNCQQTVSKAALAIAFPGGNKPGSSVSASVSTVKILNQEGSRLNFEVQVDFDSNDGSASDGFPSENYLVSADGNFMACKVKSVILKK